MAKERRYEVLDGSTADADTSDDADAEFRNDSSETIMIREIVATHRLSTAAIDEYAEVEISKSPVYAAGTANNVFFTWKQVVAPFGGATDGTSAYNAVNKYGRGELTLEPNESLFVNTLKTAGGTLAYNYIIGYEF